MRNLWKWLLIECFLRETLIFLPSRLSKYCIIQACILLLGFLQRANLQLEPMCTDDLTITLVISPVLIFTLISVIANSPVLIFYFINDDQPLVRTLSSPPVVVWLLWRLLKLLFSSDLWLSLCICWWLSEENQLVLF